MSGIPSRRASEAGFAVRYFAAVFAITAASDVVSIKAFSGAVVVTMVRRYR